MNLIELFAQTPTDQHKNIIVKDEGIYILEADGARLKYLIVQDELIPVAMDKDVAAIKKKLGA